MANLKTDVLVIGSGAGAAPAAFKLARAGYSVTMLEKGDWCPRDELSEDELAQINLDMYRPSEDVDPTVVKSAGKTISSTSRVGQSFYLVGGGTVRYSGTSWRFRPQDFRKLSSYRAIAGASLVDWPISYDELEPYYTEAELEIGISGKVGVDPTEPKRSKDVLMPPLAGDNFQKRLETAAKSLGWKPFPIPIAIHSQQGEKTGASPCMQCGWCSGYPCKWQAKSSVDLVIYPRAQETGHFTLRPNSYVTRVLTGKDGKVSGAEFVDLKTGKKQAIECRVLILAASAIQSTRLLLNSKSRKFPVGLANSSGQLGRNLMFHIEAKASATFDDEFHQGLYKKVGIHDFYFPKSDDEFINHRSIQSGSKAPPIAFALSRPGFGEGFVKDLKENFLRVQELQCMVEDLPQADNRIVLSTEKKDPWGVPVPEVHHVYHEHDKKAVASAVAQVEKLLKAAGGKEIQLPKIHDNITGRYTWHIMGTARMGNDPATSVLNKNCQSHDLPNLFILDGSPFCTSAGVNPTLTMQALSFRAGDYIRDAMKEGKI
jgi:choline dehydrogenase-like flavoprotein